MVTKTVLSRASFEVLSVRATNAPSSRRVAAWRGTWRVQVHLNGPDDGHTGKRGSQRIASVTVPVQRLCRDEEGGEAVVWRKASSFAKRRAKVWLTWLDIAKFWSRKVTKLDHPRL